MTALETVSYIKGKVVECLAWKNRGLKAKVRSYLQMEWAILKGDRINEVNQVDVQRLPCGFCFVLFYFKDLLNAVGIY